MKKQVLTSAMALAMLAPTVSAFATPSVGANQSVSDKDTNTPSVDMQVSGTVRDKQGSAPEGRIEVSLPTSISFVVDQDGNVQTPTNISVENKSKCDVTLSVVNFTDSTPKAGIVLQDSGTELTSQPRSSVYLELSGNGGSTVLKDGEKMSGLANITANSTEGLTLHGEAGQAEDEDTDQNGVTDDFTITFQVKKLASTNTKPGDTSTGDSRE